ncbi:hypothetical protein WJX72_005655 [[Myrmecia] bisecta]|uniref:NEK6-subfamily protein kinase n=1 Tax=[Myrmecia] bisecta TaxID=41462 RepID=A0AAW1PE94_9CHLO
MCRKGILPALHKLANSRFLCSFYGRASCTLGDELPPAGTHPASAVECKLASKAGRLPNAGCSSGDDKSTIPAQYQLGTPASSPSPVQKSCLSGASTIDGPKDVASSSLPSALPSNSVSDCRANSGHLERRQVMHATDACASEHLPVAVDPSSFKRSVCLGTGGFGRVWQAECQDLAGDVALKMLRRKASDCTELLADEMGAHYSLRHPNIVTCLGAVVNTDGHLVGVALENMQGGSLASLMRQHPDGLPLATCIRLGLDIAHGLCHCHSQGVVHGDIKPDNLLLTGGGLPCAKLADFGIALQAGKRGYVNDGGARGTPNYWAPELAREGQVIWAAIDVWALGAVLYKMATGSPPFHSWKFTEIKKTLELDPSCACPPLTPAPPGSDAAQFAKYMELVSRCCEVDPRQRADSVLAFLWLTDLMEAHAAGQASATQLP